MARPNDMKRVLLRKHGAQFERGVWVFPSGQAKEEFEKQYNAWLTYNAGKRDAAEAEEEEGRSTMLNHIPTCMLMDCGDRIELSFGNFITRESLERVEELIKDEFTWCTTITWRGGGERAILMKPKESE